MAAENIFYKMIGFDVQFNGGIWFKRNLKCPKLAPITDWVWVCALSLKY